MAREIVVTRINAQKTSVATVGPQGFQGYQGPQGNFGGATFAYDFNTSTSATDPGAGKLALNNATFSSATVLYLDDVDMGGIDIQSYLRTIDDSTSTIKGHFRISKRLDPEAFVLYTITSLTEETGYFSVSCSYVSGSSPTFSNNEDLLITFARTGDKGEQGPQGFQGTQGFQGNQGFQSSVQGPQGVQGTQGFQGAFGGPQGDQGAPGIAGIAGEPGTNGTNGAQGAQGDWATAQAISTVAETTRTISGSDAGKLLLFTSSSPITITAVTGQLAVGQRVDITQQGSGQITFTEGTDTSIYSTPTKKTRDQYSSVSLICLVDDEAGAEYLLVGDLEASAGGA
jgi:hypothetical protein